MARKSKYRLPNPTTGEMEIHHLETELAQVADMPAFMQTINKKASAADVRKALAVCEHYNNVIAHNMNPRGKDLTAAFASGDVSTMIANGEFEDIYVGDYIDKAITVDGTTYSIRWRFAGLDSRLHCGDSDLTTHHAVMISENVPGKNIRMNASSDTTGAFKGSEMWTTTLPKWSTAVKNAFGSTHVLKYRDYLTKGISATEKNGLCPTLTGVSNSAEWTDVEVSIPNETMIYGCRHVSGSWHDEAGWPHQLPLFKAMGNHVLFTREWFWLRSVASAAYFCIANSFGSSGYRGASTSDAYGGLRPIFLLR